MARVYHYRCLTCEAAFESRYRTPARRRCMDCNKRRAEQMAAIQRSAEYKARLRALQHEFLPEEF